MLDIVHDGGDQPLVSGDHALFHLLRGQSDVLPADGHNRNIDIRENIGGCALQDNGRHQQDDEGGHDKGVRPVQRDSNDPHRLVLLPARIPLTPLTWRNFLAIPHYYLYKGIEIWMRQKFLRYICFRTVDSGRDAFVAQIALITERNI